ncbi:radical SAM protein [archaeon]|jgi:radical SAM protein with 4Fe4S-binding SPASM domain|nr:radical SAM protein [archaeon]MBT4441418.1 radical SAM protein [archaeon]
MKKLVKLTKNIFVTQTPIYVVFFVTSVCNAKCKMCFNWQNIEAHKTDLDLEEVKKVFSNFSEIQQLTLSGGEPFLRNDLPEMLEYVSIKNQVQRITIPTNALLTDKIIDTTSKILNKIKKSTQLNISLSIEGIDDKHDEVFQVPGAFEKTKKTYEKLQPLLEIHKNLSLEIAICCSKFNKDHIKDTIKYCNEKFPSCAISIVLARGDTRDDSSKDVTIEEYQDIINFYNKFKKEESGKEKFGKVYNALGQIVNNQVIEVMKTEEMPNKCYAGSNMIVIQNNGDVFPCEYLNKKLGNLREFHYDIKQILSMQEAKEARKHIKDKKCYCTWECALSNNLVSNPLKYPSILKEMIKD